VALALSRKAGQAIKIGENIIITVGETRGSYTTVLIDAPKNIPVARIEGEKDDASKNRRTRK
jgi:carbon storage regulator CsrA